MSDPIEKGAVVRIKAESANRYTQPLRKWAENGRLGDVVGVARGGSPVVLFRSSRPPKRWSDYQFTIDPRDLQVVEVQS